MKKFLKWFGIILGIVGGLIILAIAGLYFASQKRLDRIYFTPSETVSVPVDPEAIAYGKHIFQFRGCEACHGDKLEGKVYLDDPTIGKVISPNLTTGEGGLGSTYSDVDWVRSIRYGVRPTGKPLLFMPSTEFYFLSDADLGAVIGYIKSLPPVDGARPASSLSVTGRIVMALVDYVTFVPAELIPMDAPRPEAPLTAVTAEYGEYLTYSCKVCHGLGMSGGKLPGFPQGWPSAANLTPSPDRYLPYWTEEGFVNIMRSGITRHNRQIDTAYMPWGSFKHMTDEELRAVWVYLQSLPPRSYGNR